MTKREEMARAAYDAIPYFHYEDDGGHLSDVHVDGNVNLFVIVDAILAVLETPTERMIEAGYQVCSDPVSGMPSYPGTGAIFFAMIRAIRDEATETEKS